MSHDDLSLDGHSQQDSMPEHLSITQRRLFDDGARWRVQHQPSAELWEYLQSVANTPKSSLLTSDAVFVASNHTPLPTPTLAVRRGMLRRGTIFIPVVAAGLVVVLLALVFVQIGVHHLNVVAKHTSPTPVRTYITPSPISVLAPQPQNTLLPLPTNGFLGALSFSSATDGWSTGGTSVADTSTADFSSVMGFLIHYHAGTWTRYQKNFAGANIGPISMLSADDGWAFGAPIIASNNQPVNPKLNAPFFLHYVNGQWTTVAFPQLQYTQSNVITKLHMFSADAGWATGDGNTYDGRGVGIAIVLIYDHGQWRDITSPPDAGNLVDVSMTSINEGWSVDNENTVAHYQDGKWATLVPPALPTGQVKLDHISMLSPTDGWISGTASTGDPHAGLNAVSTSFFVLHYDGTSWQLVTLPVTPPFGYVTNDFANSVLSAIGTGNVEYAANFTRQPSPNSGWENTVVMLHLVNDHWVVEHLPLNGMLTSETVSDGQGGLWVIGEQGNGLNDHSYILYWHEGVWHVYGHG